MKSYRKELWFIVPERHGVLNITKEVQECLQASGVQEGLCLVNAMNVTSSIFINNYEEMLIEEFERWLEELAPHDESKDPTANTDEVFKDVHLKRTIMGREVTLSITRGEFDMGTFEQILYYDFDGKRRKHVLVKIIGE